MKISFTPMTKEHIALYYQWAEKDHVKNVWFIEGYHTVDYIHQKIAGNGYDYPFIIYLEDKPIGFIVCCDLYAYRIICSNPKGLFTNEEPGTFCMDLFIGEELYLNKGHGTKIVSGFIEYIFQHFPAKKILIDPAKTNKRAISCYEKAGFKFVREAFDGVADAYLMQIIKKLGVKGLSHQKHD